MPFIIIFGLLIFLLIIGISMRNSLVAKKNAVENAFASIDVMLKKRYDLIPNLVETVKVYMNYEKETLSKITELRTQALMPNIPADQKIQLDNQLTGAIRSILVSVENYPQLKANENFLQLQRAWNEAEDQIAAARRTYNASVNEYNTACEVFPTNLIANWMKYEKKAYFEIPEQERQNINAKELFKS